MYGGELIKVKFAFWGPSLEAILDRLPTARIIRRENNKTFLEAEVYGDGIKRWFLSQGACLEVLEPESLREQMTKIVQELANIYCGKKIESKGSLGKRHLEDNTCLSLRNLP